MALIPKQYLKSVFSIDKKEGNDLKCIGTGFIYFKIKEKVSEDQYSGGCYLVTARHVIYNDNLDISGQIKNIYLRFDTLNEESTQHFEVKLYDDNNTPIFSTPLNLSDVVVISVDIAFLTKAGIDFVQIMSETALLQKDYDEVGLSIGDDIFFLGFPLGLRGIEKNYALCRSGSIARLDEESLLKNIIYLDAPVFPGNSGGPVFCKPQVVSMEGTKAINRAYLLGIATNYLYQSVSGKKEADSGIPDEDVARLNGHLGLAKIITVDAIDNAIEEWIIRSSNNI